MGTTTDTPQPQAPTPRPPRAPMADRPPRADEPDTFTAARPWRERLPEIIATIGASLVALAVIGFLSSTWEEISQIEKAMVLGASAAGLTAAGLLAERSDRNLMTYVASVTWATASLLVAAAVTLAVSTTWPGYGRITVLIGGAAALVHAAVLWGRRRGSIVQQLSVLAAALYAAGPFGTSVHDRFEPEHVGTLLQPAGGFFDPTFSSDAFLLTGIAHLGIAVAWAALATRLSGRAATAARSVAVVVAAFAALELNVLAGSVGSVAALLVVIGFLVYGLIAEDNAMVVAAAVGGLAAGVRVLGALFSGKELVTLLVFAAGIGMLGWATVALRRRNDDEPSPT